MSATGKCGNYRLVEGEVPNYEGYADEEAAVVR